MLGGTPNPLLDVMATHAQAVAVVSYASHDNISVWVLGIVMFHRNLFEVGTEILFHTFHQIARLMAQTRPVAKLRGDDELPQPLIAASLPVQKSRRNIDPR